MHLLPRVLQSRADTRRARASALPIPAALPIVAALAFFAALTASCGSSNEFTPCGGDLQGEWNIVSGALQGSTDPGCDAGSTALTGFLYFNEDGRYTLNAHVTAWKRTPSDAACGFSTADAGYWTTAGSSVCIAGTKADVEGTACDGTLPILSGGLRGAAEYCVDGNRLRLRTNTMLGLRFPAVLELTRR